MINKLLILSPIILRSLFSLIYLFLIGDELNDQQLSIILQTILLIQIIESFSIAGIDFVTSQVLDEKIKLEALRPNLFLIRITLILVLSVLGLILFNKFLEINIFLLFVLALMINAFYNYGEILLISNFKKLFYIAIIYVFIFLLSIFLFKINIIEHQILYFFIIVGLSVIPIFEGISFKYIAFNSIALIFDKLKYYWYINFSTLSFTTFNSYLISIISNAETTLIIYLLDKMKSIYVSILIPISRLAYSNLVKISNFRYKKKLANKYILFSLFFGFIISIFLFSTFDIFSLFIFGRQFNLELWALIYFLLPISFNLALYSGYVGLSAFNKQKYLNRVYFVGLMIYLPFSILSIFYLNILIVSVGVLVTEFSIAILLIIYFKNKIAI